ncbi:3cbb92c4-d74f-43d6-a921-0091936ee612 [Sclerotinia trifoliorum]|uniref:3cbb92c4-d74f-43d6-a921-0091936ee612 n=1 Tax=Sclerotinia trifoliorum TaxID=28548 RepID=A0A8H2VWZ0_9HELO|nr:3cbb92c4-d74f-43d6-a921-0091936ee612 [Sclerotinia trifoliorum]
MVLLYTRVRILCYNATPFMKPDDNIERTLTDGTSDELLIIYCVIASTANLVTIFRMHPLSIFIQILTAIGFGFVIPLSEITNLSKRPSISSGNIVMYSENAQIESHLSKRSFDSDAFIECLQEFTAKGGSRIFKCVSVHIDPEKHSGGFDQDTY